MKGRSSVCLRLPLDIEEWILRRLPRGRGKVEQIFVQVEHLGQTYWSKEMVNVLSAKDMGGLLLGSWGV
jgi:hypothetical protein